MHVDATNTNAGDTATLFSEVFDPSSEDGDCFAFWYHMRGSGNTPSDFKLGVSVSVNE